jgi:hypothetical protein
LGGWRRGKNERQGAGNEGKGGKERVWLTVVVSRDRCALPGRFSITKVIWEKQGVQKMARSVAKKSKGRREAKVYLYDADWYGEVGRGPVATVGEARMHVRNAIDGPTPLGLLCVTEHSLRLLKK